MYIEGGKVLAKPGAIIAREYFQIGASVVMTPLPRSGSKTRFLKGPTPKE